MNSVLEDLFSVFKTKISVIVFSLGKAIIVARWLGPEVNGLLASLLVYPSLFMTIGALGVRKSSAYLLGTGTYSESEIAKGIVYAWGISSVFSVVAILILIQCFTKSSFDAFSLVLAIAPVPFALLITYVSGIYLGKNMIQEFNGVSWIPPLVTFLATVLCVVLLKYGIYGVLMAELIGPAVMSILLVRRMQLSRHIFGGVDFGLLRALFTLGVAYAVSLLVINLNYRIDIVLMDWLSNPFQVGIYSKGAVLSQYLWQIPMMLGTIVFARGARAKDRRLFSLKVCQILRVSLVVILLGCLLLALAAKPIILLLFGEDFLPSAIVMVVLLPGVLLLTIFKVLNMDMGGQGRPMFALRAMVPALVINVLSNLLLVPSYGALGAAISSTFSYSFGALLFLYQYSQVTQIPMREMFRFSVDDFAFIYPYIDSIRQRLRL